MQTLPTAGGNITALQCHHVEQAQQAHTTMAVRHSMVPEQQRMLQHIAARRKVCKLELSGQQ